MYYYDYIYFKDYKFYVTIKNDFIYSVGLEKPDLTIFKYDSVKLKKYISWFENYFNGIILDHDFKFYKRNQPFNNLVYDALLDVKPGEVISYKDLAILIDKPKAYRAVGSALGKNEIMILIPCHRVIKTDGTLGGFGGGLQLKKLLLDLENKN